MHTDVQHAGQLHYHEGLMLHSCQLHICRSAPRCACKCQLTELTRSLGFSNVKPPWSSCLMTGKVTLAALATWQQTQHHSGFPGKGHDAAK